jgi:spore coat protein U-like protein
MTHSFLRDNIVFLKTTGLATALLFGGGIMVNASAASSGGTSPVTATFQVTMTIQKACSVTAGNNIALGTVNAIAANTSGTSNISVACSKTTPYFIGLAPSNASTTGAGTMGSVANSATNTDKVPYQLYSNSGDSTVWGNTATSTSIGNGVTGTGTGIAHPATIAVFAVAPSADFTPDSYSDTVTVNVNF